jgi:hypothetical protein
MMSTGAGSNWGQLMWRWHCDKPYQKTFWADGFGMCTNKLGAPWMVNAGDSSSVANT